VIPPLRRQRRDLSRGLAAGIDRALLERPRDRGTLAELRAAIVQALDRVGTEPGVVAPGWGGHDPDDTWVKDAPGPRWRDDALPSETAPAPRLGAGPVSSRLAGLSGPDWLPRAGNAVVAGFGGAWICAHALHWHPVAPAVIVLIVTVAALVLPLLGSLCAVVALGAVSLAGAYPALVAVVATRWWQRAIFSGVGFLLLAGVGRATHHDLYWLPARIPPRHALSLAGAGVWAVASAVAPLLRTRRFPMFDLVLAGVWAAATVGAMQALGVNGLDGATLGGVGAWVILGLPALLAIAEEIREVAGIHGDAA
jgi:hypothetical protein